MGSGFLLTSPEPVSSVRSRLAEALTRAGSILPGGPTTFRGKVFEDGFEIFRELSWFERTFPIIATGWFERSDQGTTIRVQTFPQYYVLCIAAGWSVLCLVVFLNFAQLAGVGALRSVSVFLGFIAVAWVLVWISWVAEQRIYRDGLVRLLAEHGPLPISPVRLSARPPLEQHSNCPHCKATLREVRDAYCPECRESLSDQP